MTADLIKRIDLDLLYAPLRDTVLDCLAACRRRGFDYYVTEGHRTYGRSHVLHQAFLEGIGPRAAPGGRSAHNFGLAVDLVLDVDVKKRGLQPSWTAEAFDVAGEEATRLGLDWGKRFGDMPHVGWRGFVSAAELRPLHLAYVAAPGDLANRLAAVWQLIPTIEAERNNKK